MQTEGVLPHVNGAACRFPGAESVAYLQMSSRYSFTGTLAVEELSLLAPKEGRGWAVS